MVPLQGVDAGMTAPTLKRSLTIGRHRTSVSLEEPFWLAYRDIVERSGLSMDAHATDIDARRFELYPAATNLSSAIRLAVLADLQGRIAAPTT